MNLNRIVLKLGGTIILLFVIVLLPLGFVIHKIFTGFYYNKVQEEIGQLSTRFAQIIATSPNAMTVNMVGMMSEFSGVKLFITDEQGKVVSSSSVSWVQEGTFVPQEEVAALAQGNSIRKELIAPVSGERFLVSAHPIRSEDRFYGGVYVLSSVEAIHQSLKKITNLIVLSGVGAFFLALGFTIVLSRKLSEPLIQMERAARRIARGDLEARVNAASGDEIGSLARAINDLAVDLKRYRDSRSEFFANISHELRTPVTYLEGYAKVLKQGLYASEEEREQILDIIVQESARLKQLIQDVFELAKMEEGKINLQMEWIDLSEAMENSVRNVSLKAKEKNLEIRVICEEQLNLVYADGLRTEQIFLNLLDNAIRYTEQGTITISLRNLEGQKVLVVVEDTGIGIPEQDLPYIFERFYRVEKSRSREYGGTGLGLAIAKKLMELQGGTIRVTSVGGKGTRFELEFRSVD
ncbi:MAG TPA: ATP-binding protein [Bacillales bacterium]